MSAVKRRGRLEEGPAPSFAGILQSSLRFRRLASSGKIRPAPVTQLAWLDLVEAGRVRR